MPDQTHVFPDVEEVVDKHERYWVVEKIEDAGRLAERLAEQVDRAELPTGCRGEGVPLGVHPAGVNEESCPPVRPLAVYLCTFAATTEYRRPGSNPPPPPRGVQTFTVDEIDKIAVELGSVYGPRIQFAAATGMRPEEWIALERQDIDQAAGVVRVTRTHVEGVTKPYAKTSASLREVPLSSGAMASGARVALRLRGGSASALRSSRTWPRVTRGSQVHSSVLRRNAKMPLPYRGKTTTVKKP